MSYPCSDLFENNLAVFPLEKKYSEQQVVKNVHLKHIPESSAHTAKLIIEFRVFLLLNGIFFFVAREKT